MGQVVLERRHLIPDPLAVSTFRSCPTTRVRKKFYKIEVPGCRWHQPSSSACTFVSSPFYRIGGPRPQISNSERRRFQSGISAARLVGLHRMNEMIADAVARRFSSSQVFLKKLVLYLVDSVCTFSLLPPPLPSH
jgi:hypothetical protein